MSLRPAKHKTFFQAVNLKLGRGPAGREVLLGSSSASFAPVVWSHGVVRPSSHRSRIRDRPISCTLLWWSSSIPTSLRVRVVSTAMNSEHQALVSGRCSSLLRFFKKKLNLDEDVTLIFPSRFVILKGLYFFLD